MRGNVFEQDGFADTRRTRNKHVAFLMHGQVKGSRLLCVQLFHQIEGTNRGRRGFLGRQGFEIVGVASLCCPGMRVTGTVICWLGRWARDHGQSWGTLVFEGFVLLSS